MPNWLLIGPVVNGLLLALAAVIALWFMTHGVEHRSTSPWGVLTAKSLLQFAVGLLTGLVVVFAYVEVLALSGLYRTSGTNPDFHPCQVLLTSLLIAFAEESIFRGYVQGVLEGRFGMLPSVALTSLTFGIAHLPPNFYNICLQDNLQNIFTHACLGVMFAGAYFIRRSLWFPIGMHMGWDSASFFFFNYSAGFGIQPFFRASLLVHAVDITTFPYWLTIIVSLMTSVALLSVAHRRGNFSLGKTVSAASE